MAAAGDADAVAAARRWRRPQDWPPKTVRIVVPFAPGSTPDMVGRVLADSLQARHPGTSFVVENKPGASGNIGTDVVAKAAPDGATLGISLGGPLAINTLLFAKLPYDPERDIAPVTLLTQLPSVLAVPASLGVDDVAQFVARAEEPTRPASPTRRSAPARCRNCAWRRSRRRRAPPLLHIPYAGSPAAATALIRGDVQAACLPAIAVTPHAASGALKMLAVSTPQRSPLLPRSADAEGKRHRRAVGCLERADRAGRHAAGVDRADQRRGAARSLAEPAVIAKLATQLLVAGAVDARGTAPEDRRREAAVGRRDPRREDPDRVTRRVRTGKSYGGGLTHRRRN